MERQTSGIFLRILAVLSLTGSLITVTAKVALSFDQQGKTRESIYLSISYYNSIIDKFDTQIFARQLANHYLNSTPVETVPENLTDDQGIAVQAEFLRSLKPYLGNIIGYKAALTNKIAQKRFNVSQPVLGFLLEKMLLKSGGNVPANFGAIPRLEGDLIMRVSSEKINQAKTPAATLKYLDAVIPFLELPDLIKGDLLSLGSMTPMLSVVPGKTIYARYFGLTSKQPIEIYVRFY